MALFRRLFGGKVSNEAQIRGAGPDFTAPLAPERTLAVIGDVHGCDDLLARLIDKLDARGPADMTIVTVGDYVDRGEQSRETLDRLEREAATGRMICLTGNHEAMLLEFIDRPTELGARWLRNGGLQTLASYGIGGVSDTASPDVLMQARDRFVESLGPKIDWLRELPDRFQSGNVAVVHAAANPEATIEAQENRHLIWGHRWFFDRNRADGIWVVHGHTIVPEVEAHRGRIGVDTGAYATGRLSAAVISPDGQLGIVQVTHEG